jgi:hypothetical protein
MSKKDKKLSKNIYPEARIGSSEFYLGKRDLPKELMPSDQYKKAKYLELLSRIKTVANPEPEYKEMAKEANNNLDEISYLEAKRIRENQKAMDALDLPLSTKGQINASNRIIQDLGFNREMVDSASSLPTSKFKYIQKSTGKILPVIGPILTAVGAAGYSDLAGAATDMAIPGGLEETGIADERSIPDPKYQEYIRKMQAKGKK